MIERKQISDCRGWGRRLTREICWRISLGVVTVLWWWLHDYATGKTHRTGVNCTLKVTGQVDELGTIMSHVENWDVTSQTELCEQWSLTWVAGSIYTDVATSRPWGGQAAGPG